MREAPGRRTPGPVAYKSLICRSSSKEWSRRSCERSQGMAARRARSAADGWAPDGRDQQHSKGLNERRAGDPDGAPPPIATEGVLRLGRDRPR